ncbi:MAG: hypothetical protein KAI47_03945, partial [Deltaproteobacteria bacterium]|nr:hypothetical protein [Deltaproteobacteria bacterium]
RAILLYPDGRWIYVDRLAMPATPQEVTGGTLGPHYAKTSKRARLGVRVISDRRNAITDDKRWFTSHGFHLPTCVLPTKNHTGTCPSGLPVSYRQGALRGAIRDQTGYVLLYAGRTRWRDARYVAMTDATVSRVTHLFDMASLMKLPGLSVGAAQIQGVNWAVREGDVLYLSTGYNGYAKASRGHNAYLNAVHIPSGKLIWRSKPLVCNAKNFLVVGDAIICGYGFTAEPDFLYALDKRSGRTILKRRVASGPDYLFMKGGKLYVRTYNHDYVFALKR